VPFADHGRRVDLPTVFPKVFLQKFFGKVWLSADQCTLPWLGFVPDKVLSAPPVAVARLGSWDHPAEIER
jgi:hypothetical protein